MDAWGVVAAGAMVGMATSATVPGNPVVSVTGTATGWGGGGSTGTGGGGRTGTGGGGRIGTGPRVTGGATSAPTGVSMVKVRPK